jgi:hypothetical protein
LSPHHRLALKVAVLAFVLEVVLGAAFGLAQGCGIPHGIYCALGTGATVGCDLAPRGWLVYCLSAAEMLTLVPLLGAVFSLFTAGLATAGTRRAHAEAQAARRIAADLYAEMTGKVHPHSPPPV